MPVSSRSRYYPLTPHEAPDASGEVHATVGIRPISATTAPTRKHVITGVESIESLAWRYLGTSEGWWRIVDTGPLVFPLDLRAGDVIAVPLSANPGRVVRDRRF